MRQPCKNSSVLKLLPFMYKLSHWCSSLQIEAKCQEYNKVAESLQLIPLTAENAFGIDYELRPMLSAVESDKFAANIKVSIVHANILGGKVHLGILSGMICSEHGYI